jgi:hypothetical protein
MLALSAVLGAVEVVEAVYASSATSPSHARAIVGSVLCDPGYRSPLPRAGCQFQFAGSLEVAPLCLSWDWVAVERFRLLEAAGGRRFGLALAAAHCSGFADSCGPRSFASSRGHQLRCRSQGVRCQTVPGNLRSVVHPVARPAAG